MVHQRVGKPRSDPLKTHAKSLKLAPKEAEALSPDHDTFKYCLRKARGAAVQSGHHTSHKLCPVTTLAWKSALVAAGLDPEKDIPENKRSQMALMKTVFGEKRIPKTTKALYSMYLSHYKKPSRTTSPIHVDNALIVSLQAEQNGVPFPVDYFQNPTHGLAWVSQGSMTSTVNYAVQVAAPEPKAEVATAIRCGAFPDCNTSGSPIDLLDEEPFLNDEAMRYLDEASTFPITKVSPNMF